MAARRKWSLTKIPPERGIAPFRTRLGKTQSVCPLYVY